MPNSKYLKKMPKKEIMNNLKKEYSKILSGNSTAIEKFDAKISETLAKLLPAKRTRISGIKTIFGDYVTGISSTKIYLKFGRSKISYTLNLTDSNPKHISIEQKINLIHKLKSNFAPN